MYAPQEDGSYKVVFEKLRALSNEDEDFLAGIVKGKPWGTGPKDFMRKMFDGCVDAGKNYFDDYLEPLFYTGLNLNRGENGYYPPLHRRIPFLMVDYLSSLITMSGRTIISIFQIVSFQMQM